MTHLIPACCAITKQASKSYICDLPIGHPGDHAGTWGAQTLTWPQERW